MWPPMRRKSPAVGSTWDRSARETKPRSSATDPAAKVKGPLVG